ncbi:glycosyltransferase family 87 protein [Corynebacterium pseudokroppenstedtii]|uniref:glycosyltransferase family 87 protein n=1 Tax=Corynebacterium pseudokroppenstedtii TaxID=2804917 RepID=UPI00254D601A|nr:glycosyltransferase family 87 protein [Corynebacterium pseudokroppenstedtii]MDK7148060.1 glycosyltransferase family 87 protein [Corynebacterium pseudokroppenstedtii]
MSHHLDSASTSARSGFSASSEEDQRSLSTQTDPAEAAAPTSPLSDVDTDDGTSSDTVAANGSTRVTAATESGEGSRRKWDRKALIIAGALTAAFVITRAVMWWLDHHIGDYWMIDTPVDYYFKGLDDPGSGAMQEYPVPVMWMVAVLKWLTMIFSSADKITVSIWMLLVVDVGFFVWLTASRRWWGAGFWVLFGVFFGPLLWTRWDIVPAVLVAATLVTLVRHPKVSGILLGCATMIKLWPAIIGTALVGWWKSRQTWQRIASFAATCVVIAALSVWGHGFHRITSVFNYQGDRGLQIESIPATGVMWAAHHGEDALSISYAASQSFEVFGPSVSRWETFSTILTVIMVLVCVYLCVSALIGADGFRRMFPRAADGALTPPQQRMLVIEKTTDNGWSARRSAWLALIIIGAVLISNKVMSTQYVVWWAAPLAVCLDSVHGSPASASKQSAWSLRIAGGLMLVIGGLSQWIYPVAYDSIISNDDNPSVMILVVRNLLIIAIFLMLVVGFAKEPSVRLVRLRDISDMIHRRYTRGQWRNITIERTPMSRRYHGKHRLRRLVITSRKPNQVESDDDEAALVESDDSAQSAHENVSADTSTAEATDADTTEHLDEGECDMSSPDEDTQDEEGAAEEETASVEDEGESEKSSRPRAWQGVGQRILSSELTGVCLIAVGVYALVQTIVGIALAYNAKLFNSSFSDQIQSWDAQWFTRIAEFGYRGGEAIDGNPPEFRTVAFLPGTPWLLRATHAITGLDWAAAGLLMNAIIGAIATCLLAAIIRKFTSSLLAVVLAVAVFAGFPMSVTYLMAYSEALFALCTFLFILGYLNKDFPLAATGVFMACLVRMTGYDLAITFAIGVLLHHRRNVRAWICVAAAPLGGAIYMLWAGHLARDAGGYFAVQKDGWGTQFDFGKTTLHDLPRQIFALEGVVPLWCSLAILGTLTLIIVGIIRRFPFMMWLCGTGIGLNVILSSGYFHSRPRLLLMAGVLLTICMIVTTVRRWPILTTAYTIVIVWVGVWLSEYMLTQWAYAI